jgi:hypothetical protein
MKIDLEQKPNLSDKLDKLKTIREKLESTTDSMGMPIDKGVFETIVLLNALGYHTSQSCDGHGTHPAWISFNTETGALELQLTNGAYKEVVEGARELANKKTLEKFGKEAEEAEHGYTEEIAHYWDEVYISAKDNHPRYPEYKKIQDQIILEMPQVVERSLRLVKDFTSSIGEPINTVTVNQKNGRIEFISGTNSDAKALSKEAIQRSSELLHLFENFLKTKYLNN